MRGAALCVVLLVACVQVDMLVGAGERRLVCTAAADGSLGRLAARRSAAFGGRGAHGTCSSKRLMVENLSATSRCAVGNRRKLRRAPLEAAPKEPPSARRCASESFSFVNSIPSDSRARVIFLKTVTDGARGVRREAVLWAITCRA